MKKNNLFKAVGLVILAYVLLSWLVPIIYSVADIKGEISYQIGITSFLSVILETFSGFGTTILYILLVGAFYGVLKVTGAYDKIVSLLTAKAKGREKICLYSTIVLMAIVSSISGLDLGLLIVYPILISLIVKTGYDKLVALSATVGATIVGMYGATIAGTMYGLNEQVLKLEPLDNILFKVVLLVAGIVALLVFVHLYCNKKNFVFSNKKEALVKEWTFKPFVVLSVILTTIIGLTGAGIVSEVYDIIAKDAKITSVIAEAVIFIISVVAQILVARKWLPVNKKEKAVSSNKKSKDKKKNKTVKSSKKDSKKANAKVSKNAEGNNKYIIPIVIFTILFIVLGALFAGTLYGFNGQVIKLAAKFQYVVEVLILIALIIVLAVVIKVMDPDKDKEVTATPGLIVFGILLLVFFLGTTSWGTIFETNFFETAHNAWVGFKTFDFDVLNKVLGGAQAMTAFGTWNNPTRFSYYSILLVIAMIIVGICYKKKPAELFEGFVDGVKSYIVPGIIAVLTCSVFVFVYYYPVLSAVSSHLLEITDRFNVFVTGIYTVINSVFYVDYYYLANAVLYAMPSIFEKDLEMLPIVSIMFTTLYSLVMLIAPSSLLLLVSLWISEVNYTTWVKYIWKLALGLLIIAFIVFVIMVAI